jgi:starch synthase (maltosyl-transferring)
MNDHLEGTRRVVIDRVEPEIDCGRFPIKRTVGETVTVEADVFTDGHDLVTCVLLAAAEGDPLIEIPMEPLLNDRWRGSFRVEKLGRARYTVEAWVDRFKTWQRDFERRVEAGQDLTVPLAEGTALVAEAAERASGADARRLEAWAETLGGDGPPANRVDLALDPLLTETVIRHPDRTRAVRYSRELPVVVDPVRARFGAWYEMFPRSASPDPARPGTLADVEARLSYVAEMGFDVLYLPPIHPIGRTRRKGPNNVLDSGPEDVGSPWAIGNEHGGHKSIDPALGTLEDFRRLVASASGLGIDVALDVAFQCSPDHPYVKEHPEWFRKRADGSVQFAENPPKKYEDIYPFDFESEDWRALWTELESVFTFWIGQGVRVFRVDNPHTKAFPFWEWVIGRLKAEHPDLVFLAEAFTRPKVMYRLAKLGFTQSYTYFAWRNTSWEITRYMEELTRTEVREYCRPNLWPNTPDILPEYLQFGGRAGFAARLILAATLGANYGIYGPAFELGEHRPREAGGEEYLDSEKYQVRHWDLDRKGSLRDLVARVNAIRRENPALQTDEGLRFHASDNEQILCYSKASPEEGDPVLVVANLDPHYKQTGWVVLDLDALGIDSRRPFQVHDLLSGGRYLWNGARNYVELTPDSLPAQIFKVRRRVRREQDFDYYL